MRPKLVVGNWKLNPTSSEDAVSLARAVTKMKSGKVVVGVAPPYPFIEKVAEAVRGSGVRVYAQDVHWEEKGAYTGQVSAVMVRALADGAIVGHSEVRRYQSDDDTRVAGKATAALSAGLRVIYCVGETLEQRQAGETARVLERQVREGVAKIPASLLDAERLALAYEPVWAIGTGVPASAAQATDAIGTLRSALGQAGIDGEAVTVMYGGSVSARSVAEFAGAEGIDGSLVGGASLKPEEFAAIVTAFHSDPRSE